MNPGKRAMRRAGKRAHTHGCPFWRLWGWPLALALLTAAGLVAGLLGDGLWDDLSDLALSFPVLVGAWFALRPRRRSP